MSSFVVEHDSPLSAWGQVQRDLRRRIDSGEFASGERMPSEGELIDEYGVSRPTVRRATSALVAEGYLSVKQGSGTFVRERQSVRCDLDLSRPWREQIVDTGRRAESVLVERRDAERVPVELVTLLGPVFERATFGRHLQLVDGIPIATTDSWYVGPGEGDSETVAERGFVEVGFASATQADLLRSFLDIPLIVVTTRSALRSSGQVVEVSRTSWLGSRVRLLHGREVTLGQIDMTHLMRSEA